MRTPQLALLLLCATLAQGPVAAGHPQGLLGKLERDLIKDYFAARPSESKPNKGKGKQKGVPPGLAKRARLPPGLQQRLVKTGRLPPGLQRKRLPEELEARLPKLPPGQERVLVDNDLLLIERASGVILDRLPDLF